SIANGKQRVAALEALARGDQRVELAHFVCAQAHGQAQFTQVATGARDLDALSVHRSRFWVHDGGEHTPSGTPNRCRLTRIKASRRCRGHSGAMPDALVDTFSSNAEPVIPEALLRRFDVPGPRYTSYPT